MVLSGVLVQSRHSKMCVERISEVYLKYLPPLLAITPALGRCDASVQGAGASENSINNTEHLLCGHGRIQRWIRSYLFEASPLGINKTNTKML